MEFACRYVGIILLYFSIVIVVPARGRDLHVISNQSPFEFQASIPVAVHLASRGISNLCTNSKPATRYLVQPHEHLNPELSLRVTIL